ncbi:GNAT family N-acetyltransferase [Pseudomonas fontis]|uniref:GNAT family N-acetyltransferase n=1 Tax=Pseudomonas fontis TaxID=2942633 RepID=A0ABT5P194_9PSED|nr:GNAT family N-acetyltransferase [Pseudomonas fontis]MDD0977545.1 GNAT family N-acetyltransferase [Pseudomonas fontis]MDD0994235.1 GNAT family N-acetyltransferase [Pseudomonas fontis]
MEYQVRIATSDDASAISRVVITALRESNAQDYPADVIAQVEKSFAPEAVQGLLCSRSVFVACVAGEPVATASLDRDVVRSVFVDPAYQGVGIGRTLMGVIHAVAVDAGVKTLRVPSSITAQDFYAGLGYQVIRDEFHGAERTIVMELKLEA